MSNYFPRDREMSNFLPEDLLVDVLSRLPVKSLKRFKCVSKQWRALIERPEFIQMHLDRLSLRVVIGTARAAEDSTGLPERYCLCSADEFGSMESFLRTKEEACCPLEDFPDRKSHRKDKRIKVVGSCNGLVCIQYSKYGVLVWNPWIRRHWNIPRTRVETELSPGCSRILPYYTFTYGFGYDDLNDDYKVVRMVQLQNINCEPLGVEVKVFSMKSNLWRRIQDFPYTSFRDDLVTAVLANGALHWVLSNYESNPPYSIVAIDLATEDHRLLPMPESGTAFCNLSGFYGRLCFTTDNMWVMQEDSWSGFAMELPEDASLYTMQPIGYSENERNMIFQTGRELLWFNYKRSIPAVSSPASQDGAVSDIFCSVASLVEPNCGGKKETNRTKKDLKQQDVSLKRCSSLENPRLKKRGRTLVSSC